MQRAHRHFKATSVWPEEKSGAGPNPIWVRELRSRWRRPLTHLVVLGYSAILGWLAWQLYADFAVAASTGDTSLPQSTLMPGHRLFIASTWTQMLLWMLVAPLLSSSAISGERERGMMTELQLAGLSHRQIMCGKLLSSLSFVVVMLLVPLPITALCFQMGSVAPQELALSVLLQAALAGAGVTLGLWCSVWDFKTVTASVVALLLSLPGCALILLLRGALEYNFVAVALMLTVLSLVLAFCLFEAAVQAMQTWPDWEATRPPAHDTLHASLWEPARTTAAPTLIGVNFRPPLPIEATPPTASPGKSTLIGPQPHQSSQQTSQRTSREEVRYEERTAWVQRLMEGNPICQRELRTHFRPQRPGEPAYGYPCSLKTWVVIGLAALVFGHSMPIALWHVGLILSLLGVALFCATTASVAFTREREQNMLGMLLLTRLSPLEVVTGKIGVPLALAAHWFAYPATLMILWALSYSLTMGLASVALLVTFALCASALGLWFSWVCRHTTIAAAGAIAGFTALLGAPATLVYLRATPWKETLRMWWIEPVWDTLLRLPQALAGPSQMIWMAPSHERRTRLFLDFLGASVELSLVLAVLSGLVLAYLVWALRPATIEKEGHSILSLDLTKSLN